MTDLPPVDDTPPDEQQGDPAGPREPGVTVVEHIYEHSYIWFAPKPWEFGGTVEFGRGTELVIDNLA